jgi:cytochrome c biogenesis protein CcmG/thiol:disulfide interchange protein DsbE
MSQQLDSGKEQEAEKPAKRSKLIIFLPLILFGLLAAFFIKGLTNEKGAHYIPSNLIGKTIPDFTLEQMTGLNGKDGQAFPAFGAAELKTGKVSIVNVWSSWCVSCRYEHKYLQKLAEKSGAPIYGLNYKDTAKDGRGFLARFGNPYTAIGMDRKGRVGIDFGVYGVPETFIIDGKGVIRFKLPGPVNDKIIEKELLPAIEKARAAS